MCMKPPLCSYEEAWCCKSSQTFIRNSTLMHTSLAVWLAFSYRGRRFSASASFFLYSVLLYLQNTTTEPDVFSCPFPPEAHFFTRYQVDLLSRLNDGIVILEGQRLCRLVWFQHNFTFLVCCDCSLIQRVLHATPISFWCRRMAGECMIEVRQGSTQSLCWGRGSPTLTAYFHCNSNCGEAYSMQPAWYHSPNEQDEIWKSTPCRAATQATCMKLWMHSEKLNMWLR